MAIKKSSGGKKTAKKATAKSRVGQSYSCSACGLSVTVDEDCGCVESHDIICCDTPMKRKRARR